MNSIQNIELSIFTEVPDEEVLDILYSLNQDNTPEVGELVSVNDLSVNPTKAKQLTNIRAAGTDENLILVPHIKHTLEQALEFIEDDELVEVTPESIRLRKKGRVRT